MKNVIYALLLVGLCGLSAVADTGGKKDAFAYNKLIGRSVNLGNGLDAPTEGAWGVTLKDEYFSIIKKAGFNSVRMPVRWSAHAATNAPYTIDTSFFARVDHLVNKALSEGLVVILDLHHYEEVMQLPEENRERFVALWAQLATHYKAYPDRLYFELLNEPNNKFTEGVWNSFVVDTLKVVRKTNPGRMVVVGPVQWNSIGKLNTLVLPAADRNIIVTYHYYDPFHFTHQGASWAGKESEKWLGTTWTGTEKEQKDICAAFDKVVVWAKKENRPVCLGEFGAYSMAKMEDRARWTKFVVQEAEKRGFSWAYWEFCAGFGVYDKDANEWRPELLTALMQQ
ncbi:MAG: glycoside hydrolase family 5 protein [bacterium]